MEAGWTPKLDSWRCSQKAIGFEVSIAAMVSGRLTDLSKKSAARGRDGLQGIADVEGASATCIHLGTSATRTNLPISEKSITSRSSFASSAIVSTCSDGQS